MAGVTRWYGGYGTPLMTDALIVHRDGIVGTWQGPVANPAQLNVEDVVNLERWEPWVRAAIYNGELLNHLQFSAEPVVQNGPLKVAILWHVGAPAGPQFKASCSPLVRFIRPTPAIFQTQLALVDAYADLREDRGSEILAQMTVPIAFWSSVLNLHPDRTRWTIELIEAALGLAMYAEHRFKHALACRRPMEYSPQIQPMILVPGHSSLPSGHSTEAHTAAYVLWKLLKTAQAGSVALWAEQLMRQAARVAINRTIAGLHFPIDSAAGQLLGLTLGEYFVSRCGAAANYDTWQFDGEKYDPAADFDWRQQYDTNADARVLPVPGGFFSLLANQPALSSAVLASLWNNALAEWA